MHHGYRLRRPGCCKSGIVAKYGGHVKTKGYLVLSVAGTISFEGVDGVPGVTTDFIGDGI